MSASFQLQMWAPEPLLVHSPSFLKYLETDCDVLENGTSFEIHMEIYQ
jgi:hypothetical protein